MTKTYYDEKYYEWQKKSGELGAMDLWKFSSLIKPTDSVLDFGCGGGYILEKLQCKERYGVDISKVAQKEATHRGITMYETMKKIPATKKFDVIISHHALEHLQNPAEIIKSFKAHLKKNGTMIHVVPIDDWRTQKNYTSDDVNQHFYTWTPLSLGNLFVACGYKIVKVEILTYAWLPFSIYYYSRIPQFVMPLYNLLCNLWCRVILARQIRIVVKG